MRIIFLLALLPCLFLGVYVYRKDPHPEPLGGVLRAFCLAGMGSVLATLLLQMLLPTGYWDREPVTRAFLSAGFIEETAKFLMFYLLVWRYKSFDEPFDGLLYMAYVGLGFSFVENIQYLTLYSEQLYSVAVARSLFSTPGHFLFGVVMGYFLGRARFARSASFRQVFMLAGWLAAVLLHGTYDFLLMQGDATADLSVRMLLTLAFYGFDWLMWRIGVKRIRMMQK
ncbi:MAG: PrsW family intramembrane metalloprotease [Paludibacteraceae bacterium]|nr:PrsW family intramembrane metalloprotease [Paludibacteraceae bacterium]